MRNPCLLYLKDKKSREEEMIIEVKINSALEVAGLFGDEDQARKTAKILLLGKGAIDSFK